jgi:2-dehydro-3-deoxygluconokinase
MVELFGLGEAMVELHADQALGEAVSLHKSYGGDVLNALVMAQRLGAKTAWCSHIGNDPFASGLLELCRLEGIDTSQVKLTDGENGVYFISLQNNGEREFTYRRNGSAASRFCPNDLNTSAFEGAKMLLLSGITQAISSSCQDASLKAAQEAQKLGLRVAFDPNYRPKLWAERGGLQAAQSAYQELRPHLDVLLPSFPGDAQALGLETAIAPKAAMQALLEQCGLVGLKCGQDGALVGGPAGTEQVLAHPTTVCDTTGAGDAWNGAFLFGLLREFSLAQAASHANLVAATTLGFRGAIPKRNELMDALNAQWRKSA